MAIKDTITKEITNLGEDVTIYNSTQTVDESETNYGSVLTDTYVDGTAIGTSEKAVIQPANERRDQMAEGRLLAGDLFAVFKYNSVVTINSLVKVDAKDYLYKVKRIQDLRVSGSVTHYECILEFVRDLSP